jgi:hypothetical protein
LTFRLAERVIGEVVNIWKRTLAAGESIDLPIARLLVRKHKIALQRANRVFPSELLPFLPEKSMPSKEKDQDVACPRCGGVWLSDQQFHQYAAGTYSQRVGGNLSVLGDARHVVYVCLCGYPKTTGRPARTDSAAKDLQATVQRAQQFVAVETFLQQGFTELAHVAVTRTEMDTLRRRITRLESEIAWLQAKGKP